VDVKAAADEPADVGGAALDDGAEVVVPAVDVVPAAGWGDPPHAARMAPREARPPPASTLRRETADRSGDSDPGVPRLVSRI